jgi:hypothetical protein
MGGGEEFVGVEEIILMGRSTACLRFFGAALDPEEITRLLGKKPSIVQRKGDIVGSRKRVLQQNSWRLEAREREPGDLTAQIEEILESATNDILIWRRLTQAHRCDLFCGLFLAGPNEELYVAPTALLLLGERGIQLSLDVYSDIEPDAELSAT